MCATTNTQRTDAIRSKQHTKKDNTMWYFAWMLGVGFAVLLAILNALWGEYAAARAAEGTQP
jgi:cyd operon protein YbgT